MYVHDVGGVYKQFVHDAMRMHAHDSDSQPLCLLPGYYFIYYRILIAIAYCDRSQDIWARKTRQNMAWFSV